MMPDWSQLPEELLHVISKNLDNCFDVVHARSVCIPWRSAFPFPCNLTHPSYSLPTFPIEKVGCCNLEKIPLFLFRSRAHVADTSAYEYFVGSVGRDDPVDYMDRPCPLQCSVKVNIKRFEPTFMNMVDFQIIPLGHQFRLVCWSPKGLRKTETFVAVHPLNKEEFVMLCYYSNTLLVLTSAERKWVRFELAYTCTALVTFRGRFYAAFAMGYICVIDPYSLEATLLMPTRSLMENIYMVSSGNDELFLVEKSSSLLIVNQLIFRVSKLDEKAGEWVEVSDLGDRVLLLGRDNGNFCFLAKELPDGCGVSGNSILITNEDKVTDFYKYDLDRWTLSSDENLVTILNTSPVLAFRVDSKP